MAGINDQMQRWVIASVTNHLHEAATDEGLALIVHPLDLPDDTWAAAGARVEATILGPSTRETGFGHHRVNCEVFAIVTSHNETDGNAYDHLDAVGVIQSALDRCIAVKAYDANNTPDPLELFSLAARNHPNDEIRVVHIRPADGDQQFSTTIHARLQGEYQEA